MKDHATWEIRRLMDEALAPTREMRRLMDEALAPSREMRRLMDEALAPSREMRRLMDEALAPTREMRRLMDEALAPSRELRGLMDALAPSRQVQKLMEDLLAPSRLLGKLRDDILTSFSQRASGHMLERPDWLSIETQLHRSPVFKVQEELARGLSAVSQLREYPDDLLAALRQCAGTVRSEELREVANLVPQVNPDGSLTLKGEIVGLAEVAEAFTTFFARVREVRCDLASVVGRFRRPVRALIIHIIMPLLINYCVSLYFTAQSSHELQDLQRQLDAQNAATRREVVKATKALTLAQGAQLQQWRVVTGDGIRVRGRPKAKACIKTALPRGTVVRFVEKRGPWSRIQFNTEDAGELSDGWVFNKYLTRVR